MTLVRVLSICVVGVAGLACAQDVAPTAAPKLTAPPVLIASGEASLDFGGFLQTRYIANVRNDVGDSEEFTQGFSHRRARLSARGQINKQLGFFVSGEAATGTMTLFDGFASWQPKDVTFDTRQLAVEKSTVGTIFSQDRSQGLDAMWTGESTRFAAGLHDGFRTLNTDFTSGAESDYAVTASAEWKWSGEWKQFDDFTGFEGKPYAGSVRGAINWEDGGETGGTVDESLLAYTIDTTAKGDGWNAFASFMGRRIETPGSEFDDFGLLAQGGAFVAKDWELFARYGLVLPDDSRASGDNFGEVTIGFNHYIVPESHAAKITADFTWAMDDQAGSSSIVRPSAGNGLLAAPDDQYYLRVQFQIVF